MILLNPFFMLICACIVLTLQAVAWCTTFVRSSIGMIILFTIVLLISIAYPAACVVFSPIIIVFLWLCFMRIVMWRYRRPGYR
jgi:hypothetical protein